MVKQCFYIFGCLGVGEFVAWLTNCPVPGSIIGMLILTLVLQLGWLKAATITPISRFLISNMGFFFVPPGVALMLYFDIIAKEWLPISVATIASVFLVLVVSGRMHQLLRKHPRFRSADSRKQRQP